MKLRYFLFIFSSLSIVNSFSEEFSAEDCYDYVPVNVRLDRALTKDSISRKELINATRIIPEFPLFTIISFTYIFGQCEIAETGVTSDAVSEPDKKVFQKLRPGSLLFFEKIKAMDGNGKTVYLKPFCYGIY